MGYRIITFPSWLSQPPPDLRSQGVADAAADGFDGIEYGNRRPATQPTDQEDP